MNEEEHNAIFNTGCIALVVAVCVSIILMLTGCKTVEVTKEVPVVTEHTTVQHHTDIIRDTLMMRDSVYHYVMGDTVIIEKWHHTTNINRIVVADTIRDTIPKIVTVTQTEIKEVNKLHWWQTSLMWIGAAAFIGLIFMLVFKVK